MNRTEVSPLLGDVGPKDDASYNGSISTSILSMDYYRAKALDFQQVMQGLDLGFKALLSALDNGAGLDDETYAALQSSAQEYIDRRFLIKGTAEAINAGAAVVNFAGGRFPSLNIPGTLGGLPAVPFAMVAAIATAATLVVWGREWLIGVNQRLRAAQLIDAQTTPEASAALARSMADSDAALAVAQNSGVGALAPMIKWGAIGLGAFLLYRAFMSIKKSGD